MDIFSKTKRKVRFSLPLIHKNYLNQKNKEDGKYVSGAPIKSRTKPGKINLLNPIKTKITPDDNLENNRSPVKLKSSNYTRIQKNFLNKNEENLSHKNVRNLNRKNVNNNNLKELKVRHTVILSKIPPTIRQLKMEENSKICDRFSRLRLVDEIIIPKMVRSVKNFPKSEKIDELNYHKFEFLPAHNTKIYPLLPRRIQTSELGAPSTSVSFQHRIKRNIKRYGYNRMTREQPPPVSTLLRAARDADEDLLKIIFRKILAEGISKKELNASDQSGSTTLSYICASNSLELLDMILKIPGLDVNKPDKEGNTPLHFAAQAGRSDVINMLITKCKDLKIDAKNFLGFTPLMKAALQGRQTCAKILIIAGASPTMTDSRRGLRADQWARFCGRHLCADVIEKCGKSKRNESHLAFGVQNKLNITKNKNNSNQTTRSSFKKLLSYGKFKKDNEIKKSTTVSFLASRTISKGKHRLGFKLTKQATVPKLEVTPATPAVLSVRV